MAKVLVIADEEGDDRLFEIEPADLSLTARPSISGICRMILDFGCADGHRGYQLRGMGYAQTFGYNQGNYMNQDNPVRVRQEADREWLRFSDDGRMPYPDGLFDFTAFSTWGTKRRLSDEKGVLSQASRRLVSPVCRNTKTCCISQFMDHTNN